MRVQEAHDLDLSVILQVENQIRKSHDLPDAQPVYRHLLTKLWRASAGRIRDQGMGVLDRVEETLGDRRSRFQQIMISASSNSASALGRMEKGLAVIPPS